MQKILGVSALLAIAALCGCGGGTSGALNQVLPGATVHQSQTAKSLPSGTRLYNLPVTAIRTPDRKNTIWVPTAAIVSQTATSATFLLGDGSVKTVTNVIVEPAPAARLTVSLKPGTPIPPALANVPPSYVVP